VTWSRREHLLLTLRLLMVVARDDVILRLLICVQVPKPCSLTVYLNEVSSQNMKLRGALRLVRTLGRLRPSSEAGGKTTEMMVAYTAATSVMTGD